MGRILFLSAVALVAYRYIARSNQRHQSVAAGEGGVEVLPPASSPTTTGSQALQIATESRPQQELVAATTSRAVEPEPRR